VTPNQGLKDWECNWLISPFPLSLRGETVVLALLVSPLDSGHHIILDPSSSQTVKTHLPSPSSITFIGKKSKLKGLRSSVPERKSQIQAQCLLHRIILII
jgi:hypothetical protein